MAGWPWTERTQQGKPGGDDHFRPGRGKATSSSALLHTVGSEEAGMGHRGLYPV